MSIKRQLQTRHVDGLTTHKSGGQFFFDQWTS